MIPTGTSRGAIALGVAAVALAAIAPLHAQDADSVYAVLLQSWRQQERAARPEPESEPHLAPRPPRNALSPNILDHRFPRRPPQTVRERKRNPEGTQRAKPVQSKPIPSNPHLALMTDPTLRPGDIVIFPDGPRVFRGEPGERHAMSDFVPFTRAKGLTRADRKYLTALRTGVNDAWVEGAEDTKVARRTRDVETTGSVAKKANRR
jgi:hypothetical protein